jgi:hypothetical protein
LLDEELEAELRLQFKTASDVGAGVSRLFTYHEGAEFPDQWRGWVFGGSDYLGAIHSGGFVSFGDDVVFDERAPGRSLRTEVGGQLRFSPQVRLEFGLNGVRLWRANGNTRFADEWIPRLRLDWQFTRELSLRWIGQIEAETRWNEDGTLADRSRDLTSDVLGTWLLRPGTAFYLGYGTSLEGAELRGARPRTNRFFVKASWLFQL